MYEAFFGLRERPFDLTPNPRFLVLTESHREVLLNLEYGIASRKGITLLIGEAGSGKTTVIRAAMERQPVKVHCVHLHNPTLSKHEFNEMLAAQFGLSAQAVQSKAAMLGELETLLLSRQAVDEKTVLIVDEAQSLPMELLEEIRLLANIETGSSNSAWHFAASCGRSPPRKRPPTSWAASRPRAAWLPRFSHARRLP